MLRKIAVAGLCLATAHSAAVDQLQKRDGAHAHDHAADAGGYGAPPAAYEPPAAEYGAPAPAYEAPADSYGVSYGVFFSENARQICISKVYFTPSGLFLAPPAVRYEF